ncbi:TRAP transporter small permease [Marivivens donghaensis]|uniref:TRAP transporter small permease protein n=1 Tax=Marivivens donghaensis TaxID=1699413 RepID=A0ABX0W046_9RHOB|nr:TRAP transporter small permease [Marivivens donghaensis]NIY73700.1 TRAP transporter small permease [Marivivens donghaensis]
MDTINRIVRRIFAFGAGTSMALVFLIIFVNSVRRYTIGKSLPWGEELPIYLTIYGVMFGLAYAYMTDRHIRFTVLTDMLSAKTRQLLFLITDVITLICGLALIQAGYQFMMRRGDRDSSGLKKTADWLADSTGIVPLEWLGKVGPWQFAIALGGAMLAIAALLRLIERASEVKEA